MRPSAPRLLLASAFVSLVLLLLAARGPRAAPAEVPADVQAVCDQVRAVLGAVPGAFLHEIDGVFYDETLRYDEDRPGGGIPRSAEAGGLVLVSGCWSELADSPPPADLLFETLAAQGWREVPDYSADGPGGTVFVLAKEGLVCSVQGEWDGGDDADSTYVPSDAYQAIVRCERAHGAGPDSPE